MLPFRLKIFEPGRADVLLDTASGEIPWRVVEELDRAGIRVLTEAGKGPPTDGAFLRLADRCSGVVTVEPARTRTVEPVQVPHVSVSADERPDLGGFAAAVVQQRDRIRAYAFLIGRLERDFRQARQAIRTAVEREAGIPCLWVDDGKHAANVDGVRERTRLLIRHATFVVADLTLGIESPERENPSRAHEIGLALAYERPLLLCSQEPRRYPYFSIADLQMSFWENECELAASVETWIRIHRRAVACRVLNYDLPSPNVSRPTFTYDDRCRYVGPKTPGVNAMRRVFAAFGIKAP